MIPVYWQISDTKNDALDLQVMYLYKIRTNIISQKDDDDEEAIDLKKDLKLNLLWVLKLAMLILALQFLLLATLVC